MTHLSLRRARNTWLVAHLRANTPWLALRVIAGPVSAYKLNALMAHVAEGFDPDEAVQLGWRHETAQVSAGHAGIAARWQLSWPDHELLGSSSVESELALPNPAVEHDRALFAIVR